MTAKTPSQPATSTARKPAQSTEDVPQQAQASAPPKPAAKVVETRPCTCGCGEQITSKKGIFRPGHDARAVGQLQRAVLAGELTEAQALERIAPASELLKAKLTRSIKLAQEKAAAKAKPAETDTK